jgi:hypothetical protein
MTEFSRSGPQLPTEQRRLGEAEHEKDLVAMGAQDHLAREAVRARGPRPRPWWKFWAKRSR